MVTGKPTILDGGAKLLAGYRASGQPRESHCLGTGIRVATFGYYLGQEGERSRKQATLMPVELVPASAGSQLTIVLSSGLRLEVGAG